MGLAPLFYLLVAANIINLLHLGFYVVGANIYDIRAFREKKRVGAKPIHKRKRNPLVSVVVPAHNEALGIERTLNTVRASTYKNIEIIIIDDGSTDNTAAVVRKYIRYLPLFKTETYMARWSRSRQLRRRYIRADIDKMRIVLVSQVNKGKAMAMNNALQNHVRGKFVMCLDADSVLASTAIERAVKYFDDRRVTGVAANVRVMDSKSLIGIVQRFEHMIGYRSKKFYTLTNSEFIIGGVASTYRTSAIRRAKFYDTDTQTEDIGLSLKLIAKNGNRKSRIVYAADVVASTEGVHSFRALIKQRYRWKMGCLQNLLKYRHLVANQNTTKYGRMLTFYRLPMAFVSEVMLFLEPLLLGYVIYLTIRYHALGILVGAYFTITAYVLLTLWPDEHLSNKEKLKMSSQALIIYILLYIMDIVQIAAIIQCLIHYKEVVYRTSKSTWVSPPRAAAKAA
jgi:poly-beta-1,6-N-acetyl-D-glucosamine synthase